MNEPGCRIALLLPDLRGGGAERVMLDLAHEFVRAGHDVEFVLMNASGHFLPNALQDSSVVDLSVTRIREVPGRLVRYLRGRKPDALIANMWPLTSMSVVSQALSGRGCKLLLLEHCVLSQQYASWGIAHGLLMKFSLTLTHRFADTIAAVSEGAAADLAALARLPIERISVLPNPIPKKARPSEEQRKAAETLWNSASGQRILAVGSLKNEKNYFVLLRAFALLGRFEARLMFVGDGELQQDLLSLAKLLGVADQVIFAGFHFDPAPFYATADLFVLSSDYEGFGNVIVEALSFGLPVVSTDCPSGPAEILDHGRYGRLVPVGDATALAAAIDSALKEPVDRDALIGRAADFAPELAARKYLDLLDPV